MSETLVITEIDTQVVEVTATPSPVVEIVETAAAQVIEIAVEGPQGPPGPPGPVGPDKSFTFTQGAAEATWTITHGLAKYPSVTVVDSAGDEVEGAVRYPSADQVVVSFSAPFSGTAYLN